ncbi:MAG: adenosine kinase [Pelagibacterales bacterium]|nr:adenosine kinase [Pelagibacterales bacterium]
MNRNKNIDVLGIGNAIIDVIADADDDFLNKHGLNKGSMTLVDDEASDKLYDSMQKKIQLSGGSAANTIYGLSQLNCKCAFIGKRSNDALGDIFNNDLLSSDIEYNTKPLDSGQASARCLILVTPDAERTMATFLGSSSKLTVDDIDEDLIKKSKIVYLEGYLFDPPEAKEAFKHAAILAKRNNAKVAFTLSDAFCVDRHRQQMKEFIDNYVDILFCNEGELKSLYEIDIFEEALIVLGGKVDIGVATRGEKGASIIHKENIFKTDIRNTKVIDTTGAGDFFAAGFLAGLSKELSLSDSGDLGAICSSEIISHYGARPENNLKKFVEEKAGFKI